MRGRPGAHRTCGGVQAAAAAALAERRGQVRILFDYWPENRDRVPDGGSYAVIVSPACLSNVQESDSDKYAYIVSAGTPYDVGGERYLSVSILWENPKK